MALANSVGFVSAETQPVSSPIEIYMNEYDSIIDKLKNTEDTATFSKNILNTQSELLNELKALENHVISMNSKTDDELKELNYTEDQIFIIRIMMVLQIC